MKYQQPSFSVPMSSPKPERGYFFETSTFTNGVLVECTMSFPPRLLGDGCGCVRTRLGEEMWRLALCDRHAAEVRLRGKEILG